MKDIFYELTKNSRLGIYEANKVKVTKYDSV